MAVSENEKQLIELCNVSDNEYVGTARLLAGHLSGNDVTISADKLFDFYEEMKRLNKKSEMCLKAIESYAAEKPTEHFTFSKASESVKITDNSEAVRILKEDLGMRLEDIIECSKLDAKLLAEKLGYNKNGLVNALPGCAEITLAKSRMLVK